MRITRREKKFWEQHLSCVRHITLDPKGPGVVRLHMIPPRAEGKDEPFLLLLNRYNHYLDRSNSGRQHQTVVIAVYHNNRADNSGRHSPGSLMNVF